MAYFGQYRFHNRHIPFEHVGSYAAPAAAELTQRLTYRNSRTHELCHQGEMKRYARQHLRDCLLAQAAFCDHIAAESWDESTALKFKQMARECREAAGRVPQDSVAAHVAVSVAAPPK